MNLRILFISVEIINWTGVNYIAILCSQRTQKMYELLSIALSLVLVADIYAWFICDTIISECLRVSKSEFFIV